MPLNPCGLPKVLFFSRPSVKSAINLARYQQAVARQAILVSQTAFTQAQERVSYLQTTQQQQVAPALGQETIEEAEEKARMLNDDHR